VLFPEKFSPTQVREVMNSGTIEDAKTIAALALVLPRLA
jgi:hypothetical protein